MKFRKLFAITLLLISCTLILCACGSSGDGLTANERKALKTQAIAAEQYYEEKYDCDISIEGRQYMEGNVINGPAYNTDTMIFFTSEKTLIVYEVENNLFSDNRQAEEIHSAIQNELIPGILSEIGYEYYWDNNSFFCNQKYLAPNTLVNLYHEYYDRDNWEDFFLAEKPYSLMTSPIYVINADESEQEQITNSIYEPLTRYFDLDCLLVYFVTDHFEIEEYYLRDFGKDGFIASYLMNGTYTFYSKQQYIKLIDGVYVASYESNMIFEDGDLYTANEINSEEASQLYYDAYTKFAATVENNLPENIVASNDIIYEIKLDSQYVERAGNSDSDYFENDIYIKIVPSELNPEAKHFRIMTIYDDIAPVIETYDLDEIIYTSLNDKESEKTYFYFTNY